MEPVTGSQQASPGADTHVRKTGTPPSEAPPPDAPGPGTTAPATASSRRSFLRWLGGLTIVSTTAMILTPVVGFLIPTGRGRAAGGDRVAVGSTSDIPVGAGKVVAMGAKPAVVVNTEQGVRAFSAICTHLGCVVAWNDMVGAIQCPCHDGRFNPSTGAVVSGPPPAPLPPIPVTVEGDQIVLTEG
jgi:cytochrome b6-f complex iron-sulfur subunit